MRNRSDLKEKKSAVATACRHYWHIETASGPTSRGVCKICGEEREFLNSWSSSDQAGKNARVFDLPDMLEDEKEAEPDL
jgi:hypothetical protein